MRLTHVPARVLAVLTLVLLSLAYAGPASADSDRIELSVDGRTWRTSLPEPLFTGTGPLVPQDTVVRTFRVRNGSSVPARASVEVVNASPAGSPLQDNLRVSTELGAVRSAVLTGRKRACRTVVTGTTLYPGDSQDVKVSLTFDAKGQAAQTAEANLQLKVSLTQAKAGGEATVCGVEAEADPLDPCDAGQVALLGAESPRCHDVVAGVERDLADVGAPGATSDALLAAAGLMVTGGALMLVSLRGSRARG